MSNRRSFLLSLCSLVILPLTMERSRRTVDKLDVSHLKVQIPRLIFFPECKSPGGNPPRYCQEKRVSVTALTLEPSRSIVLVDFSNGQQQQFPAAMSFLSGGKQSLRERVAIKGLASWLLAGLQEGVGGLRRRDFEFLQRQQVLEGVTVGALFNLLKVTRLKPARLVTWEPKQARFIVK